MWRLTWICDAEGRDAEVLSTRCSELDVVAVVVVDSGLGQHGVVFYLTLPKQVLNKTFTNLNLHPSKSYD